jgi:hypothetical protein
MKALFRNLGPLRRACLGRAGRVASTRTGHLLYHGGMSYRLAVASAPESGSWSVKLRVDLTRAESNDLFLLGDSMLAWPAAGLEPGLEPGDPGIERDRMFISEVAARPSGLEIRYLQRGQAERAADLLRRQLTDAGIQEKS